ncbi:hypothetical protein AAES_113581 [Amazona aestiva]|uniref:Uncharacterized protein n=1 Tax=Amazona aestiva TaxID=12930 RepID=A0A0Q3M8P9_AMAAE|nr:hypothetical protein AAES_113581 [Amazona aestiva]
MFSKGGAATPAKPDPIYGLTQSGFPVTKGSAVLAIIPLATGDMDRKELSSQFEICDACDLHRTCFVGSEEEEQAETQYLSRHLTLSVDPIHFQATEELVHMLPMTCKVGIVCIQLAENEPNYLITSNVTSNTETGASSNSTTAANMQRENGRT